MMDMIIGDGPLLKEKEPLAFGKEDIAEGPETEVVENEVVEIESSCEDRDLITEKEVSSVIGISQGLLKTWRNKKVGPRYYKLGRRVLYDRIDVLDWMSRMWTDNASRNDNN